MSGVVAVAHVYLGADRLAKSSQQIVGEKSDYYVTLAQLEAILQKLQQRGI